MLRETFLVVLGLIAVNCSPFDPVDQPGYPLYGLKKVEVDPFVVGGSVATTGQFPYQAALRTPAGMFFCGGVIISNVSSRAKKGEIKKKSHEVSFIAMGFECCSLHNQP